MQNNINVMLLKETDFSTGIGRVSLPKFRVI